MIYLVVSTGTTTLEGNTYNHLEEVVDDEVQQYGGVRQSGVDI